MRSLILAAGLTAALAAPAKADGYTCRFVQWYGTTCTRNVTPAPPQPMTRAEIEVKDAEIAKWEAFCKPTKATDRDGITRLSYAEKGCEFGRTQ